MRQMRAAAPSTYHSLLPSRTPPLLPIPLPAPSTSRRADIPKADTPPRKRLLLTTPRLVCEFERVSLVLQRESQDHYGHKSIAVDVSVERVQSFTHDITCLEGSCSLWRAEMRALEARVTCRDEVRAHKWQRQAVE
ncbi:hypothetical protein Tco_0597664 [Tanacetum coccineum]